MSDHDLIVIGAGPFGLGVAALAETVDGLDVVVLERAPELRWHPGLMFDDALLQVSFLGDLVSLVDPTHPLSFLAYLHARDRMYRFYVREQFHPTRREYEDYLRWAAGRLGSVRFGHDVTAVAWDAAAGHFTVTATGPDGEVTRTGAHVMLAVGTEPAVPTALAGLGPDRLLHTAEYLHRRADVDAAAAVAVVGSGQSGAEVVRDLLARLDAGPAVTWLTRSGSFAPLDYSKLVLEMTTPDYVDHFHALPPARRDALVAEQWRHYKGVSEETLSELHDLLYRRELHPGAAPVALHPGVAVTAAHHDPAGPPGADVVLRGTHADTGAEVEIRTGLVVAATGYRPRPPDFLAPLAGLLHLDHRGRPEVARDHSVVTDPSVTGRVFVANNDTHSHGVAAPDLGIGAVRSATVINTVLGKEVYPLPSTTAYTTFGAAGGATIAR